MTTENTTTDPATKAAEDIAAGRVSNPEKAEKEFIKKVGVDTRHAKASLDKADASDKKSIEFRVAACLDLVKIEDLFKLAKVKSMTLQEYLEVMEVVSLEKGRSWETVRKLLAIGRTDNPEQALKDARDKNAQANKEYRERKKANGSGSRGNTGTSSPGMGHNNPPAPSPLQQIETILASIKSETATHILRELSAEYGIVTVEKRRITGMNLYYDYATLNDQEKSRFNELKEKNEGTPLLDTEFDDID